MSGAVSKTSPDHSARGARGKVPPASRFSVPSLEFTQESFVELRRKITKEKSKEEERLFKQECW